MTAHFIARGDFVTRILRRPPDGVSPTNFICWDPAAGKLDAAALEDLDLCVHLAGANIAAGRWTAPYRRRILASRVDSTSLLCRTLAALEKPPRLVLAASATGIYGHRPPPELVDEDSAPGQGFLASVCREWEAATSPAREAGLRVINLRFGMVLSSAGGALARMLPIFRLGLGGKIGNGRQMMGWVALAEIPFVIHHALQCPELAGPVNAVSPGTLSNKDFTGALARALGRPAFLPLPALVIRLVFGRMGDELLLSGANVRPSRLLGTGYRFRFPELGPALRTMVG